jgi:hypothetical protein
MPLRKALAEDPARRAPRVQWPDHHAACCLAPTALPTSYPLKDPSLYSPATDLGAIRRSRPVTCVHGLVLGFVVVVVWTGGRVRRAVPLSTPARFARRPLMPPRCL